MSWKDKMSEWGGGDLAFLSEDGEAIIFVVVGEPVLLAGKYKGRVSEKIGCPVVTADGFVLFIAGKRLARKLSKYEDEFSSNAFMAVRHGTQNDITSSYELKIVPDAEMTTNLLAIAKRDFNPEMIADAVKAAEAVMQQ